MHAHSPRDNAAAHQHAEEVARLLVVMCMLATQKPRHTVVAYLMESAKDRPVLHLSYKAMHARIQIAQIEWATCDTFYC